MNTRKAVAALVAILPVIAPVAGCVSQARTDVLRLPNAAPQDTLLKMELDGPDRVRMGERYKWTIKLTNTGPYHLGLIKLIHVATEMLEFDAPWEMSEEDLKMWTFRIKHMAPGETKLVVVEGTAVTTGQMELHTGVTYVPYGTVETTVVE